MPALLKTEGSADGREDILYTGTIIDAYFTEGTYGWQLALRSRVSDTDLLNFPWMESGEHTRWFGLGTGWASVDSGQTATHVSGDTDKSFHAASTMGRLINALAALPNSDDLGDAFDPRVAKCWKGLTLTWDLVTASLSRRVEGEVDAKGKPKYEKYTGKIVMPVALGEAVAIAATPVDLDTLGLTVEQTAELARVSQPGVTDDAFRAAALSIPGVMANPEIVKALNTNTAGLRQALPF